MQTHPLPSVAPKVRSYFTAIDCETSFVADLKLDPNLKHNRSEITCLHVLRVFLHCAISIVTVI